jgi:hypothetical protein
VSPLSHHHSGAQPPATPRRRSGREGPQALTLAFRGYVDRVQSTEDPTPRTDLDAALKLADEIAGAAGAVDRAAVVTHARAIRQLARSVRQAGPRAAAQPALMARAIVIARTLASGSSPAEVAPRARRREPVGAAR